MTHEEDDPEERQGRQIPIRYPESERPLITTTAKVILFLITFVTAVVTVNGLWLKSNFEQAVDSRFDRFELRLTKEYALAKDTMPRAEYELRHAELIERDKQMSERVNALQAQVQALADRLSITERNGTGNPRGK